MFSPPFCRRSRSLAIGIEFESSFQQTTVEQYWATESLGRIGCNVNASTVMYPYPKIESGQHPACSAPPRLWFDCRSSFPERRFFAEPHRPRVLYSKVHSNSQTPSLSLSLATVHHYPHPIRFMQAEPALCTRPKTILGRTYHVLPLFHFCIQPFHLDFCGCRQISRNRRPDLVKVGIILINLLQSRSLQGTSFLLGSSEMPFSDLPCFRFCSTPCCANVEANLLDWLLITTPPPLRRDPKRIAPA